MAFPQILAFPTPLGKTPTLKRKLKNIGNKLRRTVASRIKLAKRFATQITKKQYFLPTAIKDVKAAASQNEDIVVVSVAMAFMLAYAIAVIGAQFIETLARTTYALSNATGFDMGMLLLVAAPIVSIFCVLIAATSTNFMSLALMDGANRKVYRSIRSTFKRSLATASRITAAWFLLAIVHLGRFLAVLIPISLYAKYVSSIAVLPMGVIVMAGISGSLWLLTGLLKFGLVPYVALFEPQHFLDAAFIRSRQLVNSQAMVFMITGMVALGVYGFGLFRLCVVLKDWLGIATNLLFVVGMLVAIMAANGGMVMLYRKRKLARR